jgi:hypothetical protein
MKIKPILIFLLASPLLQAKLVDELEVSGIEFKHINGMTGNFYMPEIIGSGAAFFDYDNDGDMDLYLVQSGKLLESTNDGVNVGDKLYRNDTINQDKPVFVEVTTQAKLESKGYGMGVATGDFNNDGYEDIFIANYKQNQIFMNQGDGTFSVAENALPKKDNNWSIAASIVDFNKDGFLDIYVVNYVEYPILKHVKQCRASDSSLDYCAPKGFKHFSDYLYKNNGDGTFVNVSFKAGLTNKHSAGLGVVAADFNNDNLLDYYVANDGVDNHLWLNQGEGKFEEMALLSGVAVNMSGEPEASMGVDAEDYDNDGDIDLFMTHLNKQTNTLYVNNGKGWFSDSTMAMKLGSSSFTSTGFGTVWFDMDNDGLLDIFSANGAVAKIKSEIQLKESFPFKQSNQVWKNTGKDSYTEVSNQQGESFLRKDVSRGVALADIDNDGDLDIVVTNNNSIPQILINKNNTNNNWIGFRLYNTKLNRIDVGAVVTVSSELIKHQRRARTDGSFASSRDNRVLFGLGKHNKKIDVIVMWTDGTKTTYKQLAINKYHKLFNRKTNEEN